MAQNIKYSALRTFVTVAELGNIVAASNKIGRTPSAVSMTLKQLEDSLGARLFETDRKTKLTAFGKFVLTRSQVELQSFERAVESMMAFARNQIGSLKIACVPSVAQHIMPELLLTFLTGRPDIDLDISDADTLTILSLVESGSIDLGIGGRPPMTTNLGFEMLFEDRFVLVCSTKNPLSRRRKGPLRKAELSEQTFIRNDVSDRIELPWLARAFARSKLKVRNVTSLLSMVRHDLGVAILPELSLPSEGTDICRIAIGNGLKRQVGFITSRRSPTTPLAEAFRRHIKDFIHDRPLPVMKDSSLKRQA